ncbi:calcitonin gene-related peptide type 1 receptor-like [Saccostrea echinata]|uniref:calcitonin gene-related peptide type 1 receptor-like n=1 Tax=Saccostrea echinata TaxID=191078 RepID=UPI002A7F874B|nr:calcitonin gene-related peptide type 1 receptor-like [Saccostrea echinata]
MRVTGEQHCRERSGAELTDQAYKHTTCSLCYQFLIKENIAFRTFYYSRSTGEICLSSSNQSEVFCPSYENNTIMNYVCETLSTVEKCNQWKMCCESAWECCLSQKLYNTTTLEGAFCPMTWDGWECWGRTQAGKVVSHKCPSFISYTPKEAEARKFCTENGTWWRDSSRHEHTDYDQCLSVTKLQEKINFFKEVTLVRIAVNSVGLLFLLSSIGLFLLYRQLRIQQRIKLHVHLFLSLLVRGIIELCWDVVIRYKRVEDNSHHTDQIGCKILFVLNRFGWSAPFFWMLCEGFFLHRLLIKTFERQKTLIFYYLFGWGTPLVLTITYLIAKISSDSSSETASENNCWLDSSSSGKELYWIIFAPTILCLLLNLLFFINILRILVRQVRTLPSEPSNFRKAIKATFILIPLFGLHQFFLIYQPTAEESAYNFFQMAGGIINNAQGIIVALIFCFANGEVISHIKSSYDTMRLQQSLDRRKSLTTSQTNTRRLSASSVNINQNGLPHVSSFHDISDTLNLADNNNIPMEDFQTNGIINPSCDSKENDEVQ